MMAKQDMIINMEYLACLVIFFGFCYGAKDTEEELNPRKRHTVNDDEALLMDDLFRGQRYNPLLRPVTNITEHINVDFGLAMIQLINVDEKNQIMKSNVWLRLTWHDFQLQWEPKDYGGIQCIRVPYHYIWKPDIVLFNNADGKFEVSFKSNLVLCCNGTVLWVPPAIYKSSCTIDVEYFPFDQQRCSMKFGSWTYNSNQVRLGWMVPGAFVDLQDYVKSGTWDLIDCEGEIIFEEDTDKNNQTYVVYEIKMKRKTLFFTVNLIIPCVFISFLSVCVFYLPSDAGEKITMCISILLALVVFLLLVSKMLPPSSITIPLIAKYLLFTFIMNIFSIVFTVLILNWNFRTPRTHRMSKWVRVLFLNYLPKILFMTRPIEKPKTLKSQYSKISTQSSINENFHNHINRHFTNNSRQESVELMNMNSQYNSNQYNRNSVPLEHHPDCIYAKRKNLINNEQEGPFRMNANTHKAVEAVRFVAAHLKNEDDYAEILGDWRYISMVIDRLQLYIFMAVTIGGTVGILLSAPHIFEYADLCYARNLAAGEPE